MTVIHKTPLHARCPITQEWDYYTLSIKTNGFISCEDVQSIANQFRGKTETQEAITQKICESLKAKYSFPIHVALEGFHCQNAHLTTEGDV